jgi:DNA (cytosine-5)-methyltransferase 1
MEMIRIIKEMRDATIDNGHLPRFMVWENVPGALSSNNGEDFRAVLEETARIAEPDAVIPRPSGKWSNSGAIVGNGWSLAWIVHDSQWWGVPQRRRRIALVCDFDGYTAPTIVFNPQLRGETERSDSEQAVRNPSKRSGSKVQPVGEGLSGDSKSGEPQGEGTAEGTEGSVGSASYTLKIRGGVERDSYGKKAGKGPLIQTEKSATLGVSQDQTLFQDVAVDLYNQSMTGDVAATITAATGTIANGSGSSVMAFGIGSYASNAMKSDNPHSGIYEADTARTLDNNGGSPACNQGGVAIVHEVDVRNSTEHITNGALQAGCKQNVNSNNVIRIGE